VSKFRPNLGPTATPVALRLKRMPRLSLRFRSMLAAAIRDRRGITGITFGVMALVLIGLVGLSTEGGMWLMTRSALQAGADGAAIAGSLAVNESPTHSASVAEPAADDALARNGWTVNPPTVTATVTSLTASPTGSVASSVVEVDMTAQIVPLFSGLFVGNEAFNAVVRSVAGLVPIETACVLSTAADLTVAAAQLSTNCAYAAGTRDSTSIDVASGNVNVFAFVTPGDCQNCPTSARALKRPLSSFQPPVIDPYQQSVQQALQPSLAAFSGGSAACAAQLPNPLPTPLVSGTSGVLTASGMQPASLTGGAPYTTLYCNADVVVAKGTDAVLAPGTYVFVNAALTVQNGATLRCEVAPNVPCDPTGLIAGTGVTFVFTGTAGGQNPSGPGPDCDLALPGLPQGSIYVTSTSPSGPSLKICPGANVLLSPPSANDSQAANLFPALRGVLVWRDGQLGPGAAATPVADIEASNPYATYTGGAPPYTVMNGLMYFPGAYVTFGANNAALGGVTPQVTCATLVAGGIALANQMSIFQDCAPYGFATPQVLAARLLR